MKKEMKLKISGFTLMELMVTLAIAVILATLAVPSFKNLIQDNRAYTQVNKIHTALMYARSEAIKTGKTVSVCPPNADNTACAANSDWSGGWAVFDFDSDSIILRSWEALSGNPVFTGPGSIITFSSTGDATESCFDLVFADVRSYRINVEVTGRAIVTKDPGVDCDGN